MRRILYYSLFLWTMCVISSASASEQDATLFIKTISDQTLETIRNPKLTDTVKEQQLTEIFVGAVDTKWIARFVMGKTWKTLSTSQQEHYTTLFHQFLIHQYVPKFKLYNNNYYHILKTISEDNNRYVVYTSVANPDGVSLNVSYKLHLMPDMSYKIYDVVAEGVSLLNTHRSEFTSIITREGTDALIAMLEQKVQLAAPVK